MKICNVRFLRTDGNLETGSIVVEKGKIVKTFTGFQPVEPDDINAEGWIASPGWIDIQINGGFGHDLTTTPERLWDVAAGLPKFGVTGFLPTIITSTTQTYQKAIEIIKKGPPIGWRGARPFGWHFEGPFLNPGKKGAHNPEDLRLPDLDFSKNWSRENGVMLVTMAPELPGSDIIAASLLSAGVTLSMGHSLATVEETRHAVETGFVMATHLFNAMPALDHRAPGLAGEVLTNESVAAGIIADGQHVHPDMVKLAWKMKSPDKLLLVTDAVGALGMPPGEYIQGGMEILVLEDSAKLKNGILAGSVLRFYQALRNVMEFTGAKIEEVLPALGMNQAKLLRLEQFGQIIEGDHADLTLVDENRRLKMTIVGGEILYRQL